MHGGNRKSGSDVAGHDRHAAQVSETRLLHSRYKGSQCWTPVATGLMTSVGHPSPLEGFSPARHFGPAPQAFMNHVMIDDPV